MQLEYFQMIDRVEAIDLDARTITCSSTVPEQSPIFEGHFPGYPIVPGVLMIEFMAQAGGYLALARNGLTRMVFLYQVDSAKMRGFLEPNAAIEVAAELLHEGSGFAVAKAHIQHEGKKVAQAEIRYRSMPFPVDELKGLLIGRIRDVGLDPDEIVARGDMSESENA